MKRALLALSIVAATAGCGKTDLIPAPATVDPPAIILPPPPVEPVCPYTVEQLGLISRDSTFEPVREPLSAGGGIYFHVRTDRGTSDVVRLDPRMGTEEVIREPESDSLLDAHGDTTLIFNRDRNTLILRHQGGELFLPDPAGPHFAEPFSAPPTSLVDGDNAVWINNTEVFYFDGRRARRIPLDNRFPFRVYLHSERVLITASDGRSQALRLFSYADGGVEEIDYPGRGQETRDEYPVAGAGDIFWLSDGRVMRRSVNGGEAEVLHSGRCGPPAADGTRAIFACSPGGDALFRELFVYDPVGGVRVVPTLGGMIYVARISERGAAIWVEYDDANATCFGSSRGRVVMTTVPREGDRWPTPVALGDVGAPCLCCDSIFPPLELTLEDDLAAWGYAATPGEGLPSRSGPFAWALLEQACR